MTRFIYIADTHLGADPMGYQQQKGYPQKLPEILSALLTHSSTRHGIDFILHGGDMVDSTTEGNIIAAAQYFDLAVPVYLCLGNHDLTTPNAADMWLKMAPRLFIGDTPNYAITSEDCVIHVAPNHWGDQPYYWKDTQRAHLSPAQIDLISRDLCAHSELPHIILTHSPLHGLPEAQTGFPNPYHSPSGSLSDEITTIAEKHANIVCVLGAHNHMNMHINHAGVEYVTVSSLVETPFEFKLFEVTPRRIEMTTFSLCSALTFDAEYNPAKSFAQGRHIDRFFSRDLSSPIRCSDAHPDKPANADKDRPRP